MYTIVIHSCACHGFKLKKFHIPVSQSDDFSVCHMTFTIEYIHPVLQLRQQLLVSTKYTQMVQTKILRFGLSSVLILPLAVSTKPNEIIYNVLFPRRWMINDLGRYTWMTMELISRACKIHSFKHGLNWGQILGYRLILSGPKC